MEKYPASFARCPVPGSGGSTGAQAPQQASVRNGLSRRTAGSALALGLAASLPGCGLFGPPPPPPPKPPSKLSIRIVAAARLNPDSKARSSPVVVRVYELKSVNQFSSTDFMSLFEQDKTVLANDIVTREEFVIRPGATQTIDKLLPPETRAIGVMAAFRDLNRAKWRALAILAPAKDNTVLINLEDVTVTATQSAL